MPKRQRRKVRLTAGLGHSRGPKGEIPCVSRHVQRERSRLEAGQRSRENVLDALERDPMVSTWDMSEHAWLRNTIGDLERDGLIVEQNQPYPWLRYELTDKGRALMTPNKKAEGLR